MDRRSLTTWSYSAAAILGALVLLSAPMVMFGPATTADTRRLIGMTLTSILAVIWALVFIARIFRRQDEYARAASGFSWYWGGALGLLATLPAYVFIGEGGVHWLWPQIPSGAHLFRAFALGYGLAIGGMLAGMSVAAGVWWLRHR